MIEIIGIIIFLLIIKLKIELKCQKGELMHQKALIEIHLERINELSKGIRELERKH